MSGVEKALPSPITRLFLVDSPSSPWMHIFSPKSTLEVSFTHQRAMMPLLPQGGRASTAMEAAETSMVRTPITRRKVVVSELPPESSRHAVTRAAGATPADRLTGAPGVKVCAA